VTASADYESIFAATPPLGYRLSERMARWFGAGFWQTLLARLVRHRPAPDDREWFPVIQRHPYRVEIRFVAPRIPVRFIFNIKGQLEPGTVAVHAWVRDEWRQEPIRFVWSSSSGTTKLTVLMNRMVVTSRVRFQIERLEEGHDVYLEPRVARYTYADMLHLGRAHLALEADETDRAEEALRECLQSAPDHFLAAEMLAKVYLDRGEFAKAERWALRATVSSEGRHGREILTAAIAEGAPDLETDVARLRSETSAWDLGAHYGAVCLSYRQHFWLGFDFLHMMKCRKVIDIRRKAAARLLHTIRFRFAPHNQVLQFARLRVLGTDGKIHDVPKEHLAFIDSPEHNASILTEEWKEAVYNLPELESGVALELEYVLLHSNKIRKNGLPEFFIKADLNMEFPVWESSVRIDCPRDWDVQCIGINGAPQLAHDTSDEEWQSYQATGHGLAYDEWGADSRERGLRSPHICCSWANQSWEEFGRERREFYEGLPADEVPAPLKRAYDKGESTGDRLRLAFEWIRDRLKYASLPSAKMRLGKPGSAEQIVASGVGDCVDRAYLMRLVARDLGLESEYLLAAARLAPVVNELPAEQFDHAFVRVRLNDKWLYLDATSAPTPFGHSPWEQQGTSVLTLGPALELVEVPEDDFDTNRIAISETLVCGDGGEIGGEFAISATGILGRVLDNRWKGSSMSFDDPGRAARLALREHLPSASLEDWAFNADALQQDCFGLSGRHRRDKLEEMGGKRFGLLEWQYQIGFPLGAWKERKWRDVAVLPLPLTHKLEISICPPPGWRIEEFSRIKPFDAGFGEIAEIEAWDGLTLRLGRSVKIKKRMVFGPEVERIPEFLQVFEVAQRLAVMFCRE
jgi:hypothetical protein